VAIVAAYNEGDVIRAVIEDLLRQGLSVYFVDHGSTDDTVARVEALGGEGLIGIERLPVGACASWGDVLARKEALAQVLPGDWFVHHDADEFRESPWPGVDLTQAIAWVDALGYNAIDFELYNFWPTAGDVFEPGDDPRSCFDFYEPPGDWDRVQIRCWKQGGVAVDLVSHGGHEAVFEGRRVFPVRFLLRHYPVRGREHGRRKVFEERLGRLSPDERARGWHRQYDAFQSGQGFVRDRSTLRRYDPEGARLHAQVHHREMERLGGEPILKAWELAESERAREGLSRALDERNRDCDREQERAEALSRALDERNRDCDRERERAEALSRALDERNRDRDRERERAEALSRALDERNRDRDQEWERAEGLSRTLDARNRAVLLERERAEALSRTLDARNRAVLRERERAEARAAELRACRTALDEVLASRTWRWSAPVRALMARSSGRRRG
jgi:glycosyl transferase family 2